MNKFVKILCCLLLLVSVSVPLHAKKKKKKPPVQQHQAPLFIPAYSFDSIINQDSQEIRNSIRQFPSKEYQICTLSNLEAFYIEKATNDLIKSQLKQGKIWEPHIKNLMQQYAKPGSMVLDVGAHIGTHTVSLSKCVGSNGTVIAFEPQPKIFRELFLNMALNNLSNVSFFWGGVGDRVGKIELSPLVPGNEAGTGLWGNTGKFVDLITIDSLNLNDVSLIKIDVEGQESAVLDGAKATILRERPAILIEIMGGHDFDSAPENVREMIQTVIQKLEALNYHVQKIAGHDYLALPRAVEKVSIEEIPVIEETPSIKEEQPSALIE